MATTLQCSCGKKFQVEASAGKKVKCPECSTMVTVKPTTKIGADTKNAVQSGKPAKGTKSAKVDDEETPDIRKSNKKKGKAQSTRNLIPWIAGGCGVLALFGLVICGGGGFWLYSSHAKEKRTKQAEADQHAQKIEQAAMRKQSVNNLKQIGLAMHSFHDANKNLPNHAILHKQTGEPLLSWRVAVLPYLDEMLLDNQINKEEAWDSAHNRQFWNKIPKVYQLPGKPNDDKTYYQVFHGESSAFPKSRRPGPPFPSMGSGVPLVGIIDGTSITIMVAEAANAVNWMKPEDIDFKVGPQGFPLDRLGNHWGNDDFLACMADGSVRCFQRTTTPQKMQAFITANGGEIVNLPDVD